MKFSGERPKQCLVHGRDYEKKEMLKPFKIGNSITPPIIGWFCPECLSIPPDDTDKVEWSGYGIIKRIDNEVGLIWLTIPPNERRFEYSSIRIIHESFGIKIPNIIKETDYGMFTPLPVDFPFQSDNEGYLQFRAQYVK